MLNSTCRDVHFESHTWWAASFQGRFVSVLSEMSPLAVRGSALRRETFSHVVRDVGPRCAWSGDCLINGNKETHSGRCNLELGGAVSSSVTPLKPCLLQGSCRHHFGYGTRHMEQLHVALSIR